MKYFKYLLGFFLVFMIQINIVFAIDTGVSGEYSFQETEEKTDYIKLELIDEKVILFKLDHTNSNLAREFQIFISEKAYDNVSINISPTELFINNSSRNAFDCDITKYMKPAYGDIMAITENSSCSVNGFQIFMQASSDRHYPVIAHVISGADIFYSLIQMPQIKNIRFVKLNEPSAENPNNGGSSNQGNHEEIPSANTKYCEDKGLLKTFKFLGKILTVIKILIPIVIIAFGIYDFFKAVASSKDDEVKKAMKSLSMRVISGVIIFFIPTIINVVFRLVDDFNRYKTDYSKCSICVTNPSKCDA